MDLIPMGCKVGAGKFYLVFCIVVRYRTKIVLFLITIALGSGVLVVCSAQSATDKTELGNSKSQSGSLFANDTDFSDRTNGSSKSRELFFKMMVSVLFVVGLGAGAIYISKRFLPKITNLPGKKIRIAETVHIGPRKAVHLLEIGDRRLLIGSTNENITSLADLTGSLSDSSVQEVDNN